jgi:hypothetical protein
MDIHESDWQVFRRLHSIALERFCKRVLEEVRKTAACETDYHDCYRKVYELILNHDKRMAAAFDNPRRSNAFLLLANMIGEELLTADELKQFSHEAQAQIKMISESVGPS